MASFAEQMDSLLGVLTHPELLEALKEHGEVQSAALKLHIDDADARFDWFKKRQVVFCQLAQAFGLPTPPVTYKNKTLRMAPRPFLQKVIPARQSGIQGKIAASLLGLKGNSGNLLLPRENASYFFGPGTLPFLTAELMILADKPKFEIPVIRTPSIEIVFLLYISSAFGRARIELPGSEINWDEGTARGLTSCCNQIDVAIISFNSMSNDGTFRSSHGMTLAETKRAIGADHPDKAAGTVIMVAESSRFIHESVGTPFKLPNKSAGKRRILVTDSNIAADVYQPADTDAFGLNELFDEVILVDV